MSWGNGKSQSRAGLDTLGPASVVDMETMKKETPGSVVA